ncbi:glycosyltransferase family 39 protein [Mycolicibacterium sp. S2-37]|uniref:ArnT family glycosyltransferase n=1 Tax=Mycolicibacterium sp. S2-37 TaxID=2810297 RepID=UPI001A949ECC|nr:glycosyltransferase family 39 protein [Mycolicibacterium sp. S2-37]MBO0681400.1 glycosyltransferase family 39 protein [Mycolicibacterium sp. S2-37]
MTTALTTASDASVSEPPADPYPTPRRGWGLALFASLSALYFAVGAVLVLRYNMFDPDAPSRVANAGYVVMSRQPHLSAIGFVWNPLPSLVEIPLLQFARWIPEFKTHGLAGVVQSALFMAGAAVQVRRITLDRAVPAGWRRLAVACFALHPMIVIYGASGMSEAAETLCLVWCARHLLRWLSRRRVGDLAWAGVALGLGYLTRYEVVPAACGVALLVVIASHGQRWRHGRFATSLLNAMIVLFPIGTAFVTWSLTSWIVTGELFATLSSQYGNESQVAAAAAKGGPLVEAASSDWVVIAARLLGMNPFVGVAVGGAIAYSVVSRRLDLLVPVATFGPVLAFAVWGQYTSTTFGWFRFYLLAVPLVVCLALVCWPTAPPPRRLSPADNILRRAGAGLLCASLLVGFPVTAYAMSDQRIGNQQLQFGLRSLLDPHTYPPAEQWYRRLMISDRAVADYLDRQELPDGSVLMDTFNTWGIWLASDDPKQFIITSDYDFTVAVNRPWESGVQYIIATNPAFTDADALNMRYPSLWQDGAGLGKLVFSVFGATGDERFRIYRTVEPPPTEPPG